MNSSINSTMGRREWAMLLALSLLWGSSFFLIEIVIAELPILTIVALRVVLAALALWVFAFAIGLKPPGNAAAWRAFLVMGMLNNVIPFSLIVWGQTHIASGLAAILNATTPLFTVIVAGIFLADEKTTPMKVLGTLIGFTGVVLMIGPKALQGLGVDVMAELAILGAAISYAFAGVFGRRFRALCIHPVVTAAGQVSASSIVLVPVALYVDQPLGIPFPGGATAAAMLSLALLSTAVAYILYFRVLATAGATNLLLVAFLIPVSAIILGSLFLGESLEPIHFFGMALIGAGLSAIDGRVWRFRPAR